MNAKFAQIRAETVKLHRHIALRAARTLFAMALGIMLIYLASVALSVDREPAHAVDVCACPDDPNAVVNVQTTCPKATSPRISATAAIATLQVLRQSLGNTEPLILIANPSCGGPFSNMRAYPLVAPAVSPET